MPVKLQTPANFVKLFVVDFSKLPRKGGFLQTHHEVKRTLPDIGSGDVLVLQCPDCGENPELHFQKKELLVRCDKCRYMHSVPYKKR